MDPERGHSRGVSTARAFLACLRLPSPISCNIYVPLALRAHGFSCSRRFRRGHVHDMCMRGQCTIQFSISAFGSSRHKHCQLEGPFTGRTSAIGAHLGKSIRAARPLHCTAFVHILHKGYHRLHWFILEGHILTGTDHWALSTITVKGNFVIELWRTSSVAELFHRPLHVQSLTEDRLSAVSLETCAWHRLSAVYLEIFVKDPKAKWRIKVGPPCRGVSPQSL